MYTIFILFFASLLGITIMLGRKVVLIREGGALLQNADFHPLLPDLIKIKNWILASIKRLSLIVVVVYLRIYFRLVNFLKAKWENFKHKVSEKVTRHSKSQNENTSNPREASGFLQMMSDYKRKLRNIKHRIKQEESE